MFDVVYFHDIFLWLFVMKNKFDKGIFVLQAGRARYESISCLFIKRRYIKENR